MSDWRSIPCDSRHREFLEKLCATLIGCAFESVSRDNPVSRWREPGHLQDIVGGLNVVDEPKSQRELLAFAEKILKYSVKTGHPRFMNQLFSGLDPYGLAGQWLTDTLNVSVYTYEVAPVITLMEKKIIDTMLRMFYKNGNDGDGLFCPGGSYANGSAINLARHWFKRQHEDVDSSKLVLFASEDAHYSVQKWTSACGVDHLVRVRTDRCGRMDVGELRRCILAEREKGNHGFMVFATAGTTVLGSFDPLIEISSICEEFGMWLHTDAAWGGGLIFSGRYGVLLRGVERADSIAFNPHKLLAVPQQCSLLLTRHGEILRSSHAAEASYLFQKDKFYPPELDVGDKYLQCGRRADALKFWFMWQAKGTTGFEKHVDHLMSLAVLCKEEVERRDCFELVMEPCFINVCFWFVPPNIQGRKGSSSYNNALNKVAPRLKERMTKRGSLMINYQPLREKPNFFRFVVQNSGTEPEDVKFVFDELENLGEEL